MRLALRNLVHDRPRFAVTVAGVAFAVVLMIFQTSLLLGFIRAASRVVNATDADIWICARGVPCVDFATPLPNRFRDLALGVNGVERVDRLVAGYVGWHKASGVWTTVVCVGADPKAGVGLPLPRHEFRGDSFMPQSVLVDESNAQTLGVDGVPSDVEIRDQRARVIGITSDFGSFLGSPYVFTGYEDARQYLGLGPEQTMFLLVKVVPGQEVEPIRRELQARLPEADVWTRQQYAGKSSSYWLIQTGAGGSFLTTALLGFLVGLVIVSQNIYAATIENLEEFATLRALGASSAFVRNVVAVQALASGVTGALAGFAITIPLHGAVRQAIPWVHSPWWLPAVMIGCTLVMCVLASILAIRRAVTVEPARVFRA